MWCDKLESTIAIEACQRRQKIAEQNFVTLKTQIRENVFHYRQVSLPESFLNCINCKQGKEVQKGSSKHSDEDIKELYKKQMNAVVCRGYLHREHPPVDIKSFELSGNIERAELNYIEGKHNVNIELIGRVASYTVKRRKLNGNKAHIIIGKLGQKCIISDRTARIIRYLCSQGYFARSKSNLLQSIGACIAIK